MRCHGSPSLNAAQFVRQPSGRELRARGESDSLVDGIDVVSDDLYYFLRHVQGGIVRDDREAIPGFMDFLWMR